MIGARITRHQGETFAAFQARQRADSAARTPPKAPKRTRRTSRQDRTADRVDGFECDNLGESFD